MSYTITLTNNTVFATIPDGTINTSANPTVTLVGKNYAGYGAFLDQNFIRMLENSSNNTAPPSPLTGQLWWNNTPNASKLSVYMGSAWKTLSALTVSSTTPSASTYSTTGDLWFDTVNQQVNIWTGSAWLLVGPQFSAGTGITGAFANVITDSTSLTHKVIELIVGGNVVGIMSEDTVFTPQTTIPGFANVNPGLQLANVSNGVGGASVPAYWGQGNTGVSVTGNISGNVLRISNVVNSGANATGNIGNSSVYFKGVYSQAFYGTTANVTTVNGNLVATTANATTVNATTVNGNLVATTANVTTVNVTTVNVTTANAVTFNGNLVGTTVNATTVNGNLVGTTANATTVNATTVNATTVNATTVNSSSFVGNLTGNVAGTSSSALYADVAERFSADAIYEAGTVVELGGTNEITRSITELSDSVFGVISTRAAYLMNSGAGSDLTHPPVAMTGRVPVKCIGVVHKGDRLVSAGNGVARSAQPGEATAFNVIGRALVDKLDTGPGQVEAIVAIK